MAALAAAALGAQQPAPFELPKPTGSHAIGTTTWWVTDTSRKETLTSGGEQRQVEVHAWYPAAPNASGAAAPYLREGLDEVRAIAAMMKVPGAYDALARVKTHAILDAPVAAPPSGQQRFPLLVFSHGFTGFPSSVTSLAEDLASHGYVVLSIVRPYESGAMRRQDGRVVSFVDNGAPRAHIQEIFKEWADEDAMMASVTSAKTPAEAERVMREYLARVPRTHDVVKRWTDDIRAVLTNLPSRPASTRAGQIARLVDANRSGVFGHSMGGVASGQFCAEDSRCAAGINLDGIPQSGRVIDEKMNAPFLMVYSARPGRAGANDLIYRRATSRFERADVPGTLHPDFSDMILWGGPLRERGAFGPISPQEAVAATRRIVREFFDRTVRRP